jgi:hypothetical protein
MEWKKRVVSEGVGIEWLANQFSAILKDSL